MNPHILNRLYVNSKIFRKKVWNIHKSLIDIKMGEIKKRNIGFKEDNSNINKSIKEIFLKTKDNNYPEVEKLINNFSLSKDHSDCREIMKNINILNIPPEKLGLLQYLESQIYLENGNLSEALSTINKAINSYTNSPENKDELDPNLISMNIDKTLIELTFSDNFRKIKEQMIENAAKAYLIGNDFLITKSLLNFGKMYVLTGQQMSSKTLFEQAILNYKSKNVSDDRLVRTLSLSHILAIENKKKVGKQFLKLYKDVKWENPNSQEKLLTHLVEMRTEKMHKVRFQKNYENIKKCQNFIDFLTNKTRPETEFAFPPEILSYALLKKWANSKILGREVTAESYLEIAKSIIKKNFPPDAPQTYDFYTLLTNETLTQLDQKETQVQMNKLAQMVSQMSPVMNKKGVHFNILLLKSLQIIYSAIQKEPQREIFPKYDEFLKIHQEYFGENEDSEVLFYLNSFLQQLGYRQVFRRYMFSGK
jgi:tetratricopeptide (TPR) repeat protein